MKVVLISDTHGLHDRLKVPNGDMIIHAGDVSGSGTESEVLSFLNWFSSLNFKHKVFVAGNHDFILEERSSLVDGYLCKGVTYLQNSSIEIEGLKIYGSPYTPNLNDWAFLKSKKEMKKEWDLVPNDLDILVTHSPPYKILDYTILDGNIGCQYPLNRVLEVNPRIHVFGHVHEAHGMVEISGTKYFNACSLDENYSVKNAPFLIVL